MSEELTQAQQALGKTDLLDQLLKPEVQESLTTLVEQLPKLTEVVNLLTKTYDLDQNLLKFRFKDGKMATVPSIVGNEIVIPNHSLENT